MNLKWFLCAAVLTVWKCPCNEIACVWFAFIKWTRNCTKYTFYCYLRRNFACKSGNQIDVLIMTSIFSIRKYAQPYTIFRQNRLVYGYGIRATKINNPLLKNQQLNRSKEWTIIIIIKKIKKQTVKSTHIYNTLKRNTYTKQALKNNLNQILLDNIVVLHVDCCIHATSVCYHSTVVMLCHFHVNEEIS